MSAKSLRELQTEVSDWAKRAVPNSCWRGIIQHLRNEVEELDKEEFDPHKDKMGFEMADIVILVCHLAGREGIDLQDFVEKKIIRNNSRIWSEPDKVTGVIHHLKDPVPVHKYTHPKWDMALYLPAADNNITVVRDLNDEGLDESLLVLENIYMERETLESLPEWDG